MPYCDEDVVDHVVNCCDDIQQADIDSVAIIDEDHGITDFENTTEWETAIAAGKVKIAKEISGFISEPSEVSIPNPKVGGADNIVSRYNYMISWEDSQVSDENDAFYASLTNKSKHIAVRFYYENKIRVGLYQFTLKGKPVFGEKGGILKYTATAEAKLKPNQFMTSYNEPAGIFDADC